MFERNYAKERWSLYVSRTGSLEWEAKSRKIQLEKVPILVGRCGKKENPPNIPFPGASVWERQLDNSFILSLLFPSHMI